ncbi:benzoylformate decarboxylase [Saccharopolyspora rectivirgula]|jgi:benzoylformate decarboxylase|uniref:benzoylformate decarboxylase n=1 Tax=Saccharopolyspora rectivirgula TaxID=28042 RepID=UPI00240A47F9|nr:benzoylformate decarboxylase [Saccharopolyspora rectivirgula]
MTTAGRTVREMTRSLMRDLGLTTVFGNPGTTEVPFLTDWPDDFRYVLGLQESVVVAIADGYSQATRQPVLVNLHSAGGVGHALGAVFSAYRNRTPMIITAGQQTRTLMFSEPFLGATDAAEFPKPYVKWSYEPARAEDVPAALVRAHQIATTPPCGPVFVSIPADDWDQPGTEVEARPRVPGFAPDPGAVAELAEALRNCRRPAFVVGPAVDADGVVEEMVQLVERTKAAVWVAPMSPRCSFPEDHPQFAGFLQPEQRLLTEELADYDLVVVWGAPAFTYHVYRGEATRRLPEMFLVHDDPQVLARARAGKSVLGSLAHSVRQVAELVEPIDRPLPRGYERPEKPAPATPLPAAYVLSTIAEAMPENTPVVEEIPSHRNDLHEHFPIRSTDGGFFTGFSGALGYGIGASVGVALANPHRRTVALLGDGSSMYGIQAIWTAVQEQAPVTFVVLDNSRYAAVAVLGEAAGGNKLPGVELGGIDFVQLASSLGCPAKLVTTPEELDDALRAEFNGRTGPALLHVKVGPGQRFLY